MKKILLSFAGLCLLFFSVFHIIGCNRLGFVLENRSPPSGRLCSNPFESATRVENWLQAHGTPQIMSTSTLTCGNPLGAAIHAGNNVAYLNSSFCGGCTGGIFNEGIYQNLSTSLQGGKAYQIRFWTTTPYIVMEAANGITPYIGNTFAGFPSISSGDRQVIYSGKPSGSGWQQVTVTFYPKTTFSQIWFYPGPGYGFHP